MRLTKLEYMNRFTDEELGAIYAAARVNTAIEVWLAKFNATTPDLDSKAIDLTDPRTVYGVNALEAAGLLGAGRASEILSFTEPDGFHHLVKVEGTTFRCTACNQHVSFAAYGAGEPSVDEFGNAPANPETWMGPCNG